MASVTSFGRPPLLWYLSKWLCPQCISRWVSLWLEHPFSTSLGAAKMGYWQALFRHYHTHNQITGLWLSFLLSFLGQLAGSGIEIMSNRAICSSNQLPLAKCEHPSSSLLKMRKSRMVNYCMDSRHHLSEWDWHYVSKWMYVRLAALCFYVRQTFNFAL